MKNTVIYAAGLGLTIAVIAWIYPPNTDWTFRVMTAFFYGWVFRYFTFDCRAKGAAS